MGGRMTAFELSVEFPMEEPAYHNAALSARRLRLIRTGPSHLEQLTMTGSVV
jgi:hypothetical protein